MCLILNQSTWRPTAVTALETSIVSQHQKKDSNTKRTSFCPDTSTMSRSLLNKRHFLHNARDSKVMILQVNNSNIFLKGDVSKKSKMDTTIDFVKYPKHSRINIFLEHFFCSKNLE